MNIHEKKWFLAFPDHHEGPFTPDELHTKMGKGGVDSNPFVWCEGMPDWTRFSDSPLAKEAKSPKDPKNLPPLPPNGPAKAAASKAAKPTYKPPKDENDLSGFIELKPQSAEDRTELINRDSLKAAKKEAAKVAKAAGKPNLNEGEPSPVRKWGVIGLGLALFIVLGFFLKYGKIF